MSLKENVDYIKQEISTEEQFFESFFKVEKIYKKYKLLIIGTVIAVLAYFIGSAVNDYIKEQNTIAANNAYNLLIKNTTDKSALHQQDILKEKNEQLLQIALYKNSKDFTLKNDVIYLEQIAKFNEAIKNNDIKALNVLILDSTFVLRDYAMFNKALIQANNNEFKKAKATLNNIKDNSQVTTLSNLLKHYLLTK